MYITDYYCVVVGGVTVIFLATSERVLQKATTDPSAAASTAVQQENGRGLYLLPFFCILIFSTGLTWHFYIYLGARLVAYY